MLPVIVVVIVTIFVLSLFIVGVVLFVKTVWKSAHPYTCGICNKNVKKVHSIGFGGWIKWCNKCYEKHKTKIVDE